MRNVIEMLIVLRIVDIIDMPLNMMVLIIAICVAVDFIDKKLSLIRALNELEPMLKDEDLDVSVISLLTKIYARLN